ncbi:methyltransferase family protein [Mongoliitalea daihaiensis]|uniref:methyltransferase family protein n=1 Tax=Mongoliitalea daihaiensis TaxID=2782006 RepID=UPI001F28F079|nr:isoprenylcysteine carboxylmethyltransferase family protein [Mongoliitalea daihaiensis]UJP66186.1 isoprenylcysteine carboxylmethyltransferase family protein [Mongoliitalea daihaiensis]
MDGSYLYLIMLWIIFYTHHTLFASLNIKRKIKALVKKAYLWNRLSYSIISGALFLGIFIYAGTLKPIMLLQTSDILTYIGYMLAAFGTIILVKSFKNFSGKRFAGLTPHDDLEQKDTLIQSGIHGVIRHPIYAGLVLIFIGYFLFSPTLGSLIHMIMLMLYLPIGIHFEEKKLIQVFGNDYLTYKRQVPALIPTGIKKPAN